MTEINFNWIYSFLFFGIAALIVIAVTPFIKKLAFKIDAVDNPSKRRVNKKPIARLGGVAMVIAICVTCIIAAIGVKYLQWSLPLSYKNPANVNYIIAAIGVLIVFAGGIIDDVKCLPPKKKLLIQIIGALITSCSGLLLCRIMNPFTGGFIEFGWFSYPITIFYLVAFCNVINLIDGLDGLASGITIIVAGTIFIFAISQNKADAAILSLAIMGACMGFLVFNYNPAKIFMGDSGSLTLGFLLGVTSLLATTRTAVVVSMMVPVLAAGVPIIDTLCAILRRKKNHMPIGQPDTGHIHHRLLKKGLSTKKTVWIMWGWTALLSICGIVMTLFKDGFIDIIVFVIATGFTVFMVIKLHLFEPVLKHHYYHRPKKNRKYRKTLYGIYNKKIINNENLKPNEILDYIDIQKDIKDNQTNNKNNQLND